MLLSLTQRLSLCFKGVDLMSRPSAPHFKLDDQGWILRCETYGFWRPACWLPYARRHEGVIAYSGDRVCIGASNGTVTILDFSAVKTPP
jgi:hypothetical protein